MEDVVKISRETSKEDELFDYVDAPYYLKTRRKDYDNDYDKSDGFDMCRKNYKIVFIFFNCKSDKYKDRKMRLNTIYLPILKF